MDLPARADFVEVIQGKLVWAPECANPSAHGPGFQTCRMEDFLAEGHSFGADPVESAGLVGRSPFGRPGPLGLDHTLRFCQLMRERLGTSDTPRPEKPALSSRVVALCTRPRDRAERTNAAVLLGAYLLLCRGWNVDAVVSKLPCESLLRFPGSWIMESSPDKSMGTSRSSSGVGLRVEDCWSGIQFARDQGWLSPRVLADNLLTTFAITKYRNLAMLHTTWLAPGRLLVSSDWVADWGDVQTGKPEKPGKGGWTRSVSEGALSSTLTDCPSDMPRLFSVQSTACSEPWERFDASPSVRSSSKVRGLLGKTSHRLLGHASPVCQQSAKFMPSAPCFDLGDEEALTRAVAELNDTKLAVHEITMRRVSFYLGDEAALARAVEKVNGTKVDGHEITVRRVGAALDADGAGLSAFVARFGFETTVDKFREYFAQAVPSLPDSRHQLAGLESPCAPFLELEDMDLPSNPGDEEDDGKDDIDHDDDDNADNCIVRFRADIDHDQDGAAEDNSQHDLPPLSTPGDVVSWCREHGVRAVVHGVSEQYQKQSSIGGAGSYDRQVLVDSGREHQDVLVAERGLPGREALRALLEGPGAFSEGDGSTGQAVWVRSKDGSSCAMVLACCLLVDEHNIPGRALLGWVRIACPGAITIPQQENFLCGLRGNADLKDHMISVVARPTQEKKCCTIS